MAGMNLTFGQDPRAGEETYIDPRTGQVTRRPSSAPAAASPLRPGSKQLTPQHVFRPDASGAAAMTYVPPSPAEGVFVGAGGLNYGSADAARRSLSPTGGSSGDDRRHAALDALSAEVRGQGVPGYTAPQTPVTRSGYAEDPAADRAAYGKAKERIGLGLQSALRGLRESMAARGIGGSGIEGQEMGNLFAGGLGELADTDRQLAEASSQRAFTAGQADTDRQIQQQQWNAGQVSQAEQARMAANARQLEMLFQIARSY